VCAAAKIPLGDLEELNRSLDCTARIPVGTTVYLRACHIPCKQLQLPSVRGLKRVYYFEVRIDNSG
jgi:hypothetical protein